MTTPEGKVKEAVKKVLIANRIYPFMDVGTGKAKDAEGVFYMPVAGPFSVHGVHDFVGCFKGRFFSIETKAPDAKEDATPHQQKFAIAVNHAGGIAVTGVRDADQVQRLINTLKGTV
jgi:hypothetical protein